MCRVVELLSKTVIVEFPAGHSPYRVTMADGRVMLIEEDDVAPRDLSPQPRRCQCGHLRLCELYAYLPDPALS